MKVNPETYLMKVNPETYLMKVNPETYLMKVNPETYLMKRLKIISHIELITLNNKILYM
jgi:hypothetical protein